MSLLPRRVATSSDRLWKRRHWNSFLYVWQQLLQYNTHYSCDVHKWYTLYLEQQPKGSLEQRFQKTSTNDKHLPKRFYQSTLLFFMINDEKRVLLILKISLEIPPPHMTPFLPKNKMLLHRIKKENTKQKLLLWKLIIISIDHYHSIIILSGLIRNQGRNPVQKLVAIWHGNRKPMHTPPVLLQLLSPSKLVACILQSQKFSKASLKELPAFSTEF